MARSSDSAGYSRTPLPKKLGIKPGSVTALIGAPKGFESTLGPLPEGARLRRGARGRFDLVLWFPRSRKDLEARVAAIARLPWSAGLWIHWPKKTSGVVSDLDGNGVRSAGLAAGLVDYKVAAVDATWSGLKFARRKGDD
jgi:hypothetical protein